MHRPVALLAAVLGAITFGAVVGLLAIQMAVLPAPMCPRAFTRMTDVLQGNDPGRLLVCLYDRYGRLMNETHILRQSPPAFPTPLLPAPRAQEV
jgi:hypothetical protein